MVLTPFIIKYKRNCKVLKTKSCIKLLQMFPITRVCTGLHKVGGGWGSTGDTVASPQTFLIRLLRGLIDKQTWTDEGSVSERMLRSQVLLLACVRKYQPCVQKAEGYFREWKEANGNLRSVLTIQPIHSCKGYLFYIPSSLGAKPTINKSPLSPFLGK